MISYQESYDLLSGVLWSLIRSLFNRLQHSYQESFDFLAGVLSTDYSSLIKRLQHSYQQITALLSRDYKTLINRLQHSYREITTKHNKMLEYLNFCLLYALFTLIFYLYFQMKKYFPLLTLFRPGGVFRDPQRFLSITLTVFEIIL